MQKENETPKIALLAMGLVFAIFSPLCAGNSEITRIFGVPIVAFGIAGYSFMILSTLASTIGPKPTTSKTIYSTLVTGGFFFTIFLIYRSIENAFLCPLCMGVLMINIVLFVMLIWPLPTTQKQANKSATPS
ncbi:vitamin K epoxide reductase family protein [archaeon]|jgi:uncharacterized membrane protein|nr:vitamin K epoxide reductase family protein [archaeon]MBT7128440.1 vitamin K epoxide reductase family protein [archaeon]